MCSCNNYFIQLGRWMIYDLLVSDSTLATSWQFALMSRDVTRVKTCNGCPDLKWSKLS
jgi:hypothetical protein